MNLVPISMNTLLKFFHYLSQVVLKSTLYIQVHCHYCTFYMNNGKYIWTLLKFTWWNKVSVYFFHRYTESLNLAAVYPLSPTVQSRSWYRMRSLITSAAFSACPFSVPSVSLLGTALWRKRLGAMMVATAHKFILFLFSLETTLLRNSRRAWRTDRWRRAFRYMKICHFRNDLDPNVQCRDWVYSIRIYRVERHFQLNNV